MSDHYHTKDDPSTVQLPQTDLNTFLKSVTGSPPPFPDWLCTYTRSRTLDALSDLSKTSGPRHMTGNLSPDLNPARNQGMLKSLLENVIKSAIESQNHILETLVKQMILTLLNT